MGYIVKRGIGDELTGFRPIARQNMLVKPKGCPLLDAAFRHFLTPKYYPKLPGALGLFNSPKYLPVVDANPARLW